MITNPALNSQNAKLQSADPKLFTNNLIQTVFSIFFIVTAIYFAWYVIMAGYHFITSQGDPKRIESAKNEITYALVGVVVIFSIFAILKFIGSLLGIQGLESLSITWPSL